MNTLIRTLVLFLLTTGLWVAASAATFTVNTTDDTQDVTPGDGICADAGSNCSFRAAITESNALIGGDIITLPAGFYTQSLAASDEDANAGGDWDITHSLTINGAGAEATVIQAAASPGTATERVMEIVGAAPVVTINNVLIRYGNKTGAWAATKTGGGIRNAGTLTINNSNIFDNNATGGGGIHSEKTITLNNVSVANNKCSNTTGSCFGGGMYSATVMSQDTVISNSSFINNQSISTATDGFGFAAGLGVQGSQGFYLAVTGTLFSGNQGIGNGNGGSNGSGIRAVVGPVGEGYVNITDCTLQNNSGSGGTSVQGSGIAIFNTVQAFVRGTIRRTTIQNNTATAGGGGIFMDAQGNGISMDIINSALLGNDGGTAGGALAMTNAGSTGSSVASANIDNTTISGNTAANGGGIYTERPVTGGAGSVGAAVDYSTVVNNSAPTRGGGLYTVTGYYSIRGSIIAGNTSALGPDMSGTMNSQDYNHFGTTSGATIVGGIFNNSFGDPMLGTLQNNGGTTLSYEPLAGSPVVNSIPGGVAACGDGLSSDQRNFPRPIGIGCDKGSVERLNLAPGPWDLGGTVRDSAGRPISNVTVTVTGGSLTQPLLGQTGSLGIYNFIDLPGGTYSVSLSSKRYTFSPDHQMVSLGTDMSTVDFNADPGSGSRLGSQLFKGVIEDVPDVAASRSLLNFGLSGDTKRKGFDGENLLIINPNASAFEGEAEGEFVKPF